MKANLRPPDRHTPKSSIDLRAYRTVDSPLLLCFYLHVLRLHCLNHPMHLPHRPVLTSVYTKPSPSTAYVSPASHADTGDKIAQSSTFRIRSCSLVFILDSFFEAGSAPSKFLNDGPAEKRKRNSLSGQKRGDHQLGGRRALQAESRDLYASRVLRATSNHTLNERPETNMWSSVMGNKVCRDTESSLELLQRVKTANLA